jgi:hypothetical protein
MTRWIACLAAGLLCVPAAASAPHGAAAEFSGLRVGLAGCYKAGLWTPVELTIHGGSTPVSGTVAVTVLDGDGVPSRVTAPSPVAIRPDGETIVRLLVRFGRVDSRLTAELRDERAVVARRTFETSDTPGPDRFLPAVDSSRPLWVIVGPGRLGVDEALTGHEQGLERNPAVARLDGVGPLPDEWFGYEGVDTLILATSRPEIYRALGRVQREALDRWIRMGGTLLLVGGAEAAGAIGPQAPLAQFAPGRFEQVVALEQTGALETYCNSLVPVPAVSAAGQFRVARLGSVDGLVEAQEADLPLVVRSARGFGQIVFLAADLEGPPLGRWAARGQLLRRLLDLPPASDEDLGQGAAATHYGYLDIAGQLRQALCRFEGVTPAPFWLVVLLVLAYAALIGPADYFFLRRVVGRMTFTWISFSLLVVAASLGACFLAWRLKGNEVRLSRAEVIDVDAVGGQVRAAAWMEVFSPAPQHYNFTSRPTLPDGQPAAGGRVLLAWLGFPGSGLGGMARAGGPSPLGAEGYDFSPRLDGLQGVPIPAWATKGLTARWDAPWPSPLTADLTAEDQVLTGSITNRLPLRLTQCVLAFGTWAYELGDLPPGGSAALDSSVRRSQLRTYLVGAPIVDTSGDKYRLATRPYDPSSVDLPYILRRMMFFEAGGGVRYTGLVNRYQAFVDLAATLRAGRAVLLGSSAESEPVRPGTELLDDGRPLGRPGDTHVVCYRFVLPVKSRP